MNEVMNAILTRRSIRKYENKAVPGELLDQILQAGIYAPSGKNRQTQRFFVMRDEKNKEQLRQVIGQALDNPAYTFYGADTLIFVMVDLLDQSAEILRSRTGGKGGTGRISDSGQSDVRGNSGRGLSGRGAGGEAPPG